MTEPLKIVITANGEGSRMKALSPKPKHLLYYGGKRIIDCIVEALSPFGKPLVFGVFPGSANAENWMVCASTESRKAQLELIRDWKNVLIVDCDVIPINWIDALPKAVPETDVIWFFPSTEPKYGGLYQDENGILESVTEKGDTTTNFRASGLYFLKDVGATVDRMTDPNSIAAAMVGAKMVYENTFIRVGDPDDYLNALK